MANPLKREHDKMWGGTGDLYGNTVAGIWRTPHFVMLLQTGVSSPARWSLARLSASRRLVLTRSPGRCGISDGATTAES
jgi:hypothetical protein